MTQSVIQAQALRKRYGGANAVDGISFEVTANECFGILGPNGAGKSTTLRMITGLTPKDGGELNLFGQPMDPANRELPLRVGVVSQDDNLDDDLSVAENLLVYGRYFGLSDAVMRPRVGELLEFAQLSDRAERPVRSLSGGMKRRLVIARSLVAEPELVILDEPTTGLDPQARHLIWQRLRALKERGITLLLTTHYMEEAAQLCDRLLILNHGRILDMGAPRALIQRHVEPEVVEIRAEGGGLDHAAFAHLPGRQVHAGDTLFCHVERAGPVFEALGDRPDLTVLARPANLEDVFLKLTGRELRD
ncbi:ATP-binding cassette domain-containing protein [Magnetofaba australis]|uniref:Putative ABC transporter n=1 Tax=Magnetofaba australis IT-1 TaxID=1434232 RepID=A0A1Y2K817_9PROT|nr:ATP-binding cassette domain-containing protein [Magnetofaba australis]OSM06878.1 putative ABC transporter [Magnetofaba australis IT-1]